jgi:hypothetical protein
VELRYDSAWSWTNESKLLKRKEIEVEPAKHKTRGTSSSYTFELPYENDLDQDELNRRLQKPGEATRSVPGAKENAANDQSRNSQGKPS